MESVEPLFPDPATVPIGPIGLGYASEMIELTLRADDVIRLDACRERGWIDRSTRAFDNQSLRRYALSRMAVRCESRLAEWGYPT